VIGQWICLPDPTASGVVVEVDSDQEEDGSFQQGAPGPNEPSVEGNAARDLSAALKALKNAPVQPMPMQAFFVANSKTNA
jgi:hypothetical protein